MANQETEETFEFQSAWGKHRDDVKQYPVTNA